MLFLFLSLILIGTGSGDHCVHSQFTIDNGNVIWTIPKNDSSSPGTIRCNKGYVFDGKMDIVYCVLSTWVKGDPKARCIEDPFVQTKEVTFHGQTYNYTFIKMGTKTQTYPIVNPNISYIITTNYTADTIHPTIRVRVGLVGKAINPVLINIQQSTESVGFELPIRVIGKGSQELAPVNERTVELCPITLDKDKNGKRIPVREVVKITANSVQPKGTKSLSLQVHATYAMHIDLDVTTIPQIAHASDSEDLVYRFAWPEYVYEVDILVVHYKGDKVYPEGKGPDVCAKVSLRCGKCPMEEMGVSELTFTRKAFMTVSKYDKRLKHIEDGFLVVIEVMPDDYECRDNPDTTESLSRTKTVQTTIRVRASMQPYSFLAMPILCSCFLAAVTLLTYFLCVLPLFKKTQQMFDEDDSSIIDVADTEPILKPSAILPPFDQPAAEEVPKMVDFQEVDFQEEEKSEKNPDDVTGDEAEDVLGDIEDVIGGIRNKSFTASIDGLTNLLRRVKQNELIVNLTQTIGHCSIPLLVFLNSFDSAYVDIEGNLKSYTLDGNLDACFINTMCAFPVNISNYRVPDISRVTSNMPYLMAALCFYLLAMQKSIAMKPINARGLGVKHDFAIFYALAFITGLIGLASAMYHVCPNQTTSRIDMYFIEILLGYLSLKLYQSRVPDIRAVYYAPAIVICVLSAIERVMGDSDLSWDLIAGFHIAFTFWISIQLFFMGKVSMNPYTMFRERGNIYRKIQELKENPEFKYQIGAFLLGNVATLSIGISGAKGMWTDHAMYNVVALSADIVIYLVYYFGTKYLLRKEKIRTDVVVFLVSSALFWILSFIFFFTYKSIDTNLSPAESRCLNKACIVGPIEGHDLWHCLSATAILLTNIMILLIDDDLIAVKTEETYF